MNVMKLGETPISEEVLELDPREYRVKSAAMDAAKFEDKRARIFPQFQSIGAQLAKIEALPLQEEPAGSGNVVTSGNFSIRDDEGGFFITGTGVNKERPTPEGILYVERVDYEKGEIFTAGSKRHSRETLIHDLIYRTFPQVSAVVHTHDQVALLYDRSPLTDEPIFFATVGEAQKVVDLLKKGPYVHLRNHGQFVAKESVEAALALSVQRHRRATGRSILHLIRDTIPSLAIAAGLVLAFETAWNKKFEDCEVRGNNDGTQSYICTTERNCGPINDWEGEKEGWENGDQYECRYSMIPGVP